MLETDNVPVFWRAICHVPVDAPTVKLSEAISTPVALASVDTPMEFDVVLVVLVPLDGRVR